MFVPKTGQANVNVDCRDVGITTQSVTSNLLWLGFFHSILPTQTLHALEHRTSSLWLSKTTEPSRVKTATTASNLVVTAETTLAGSIPQPVFLDSYQLFSQLTDLVHYPRFLYIGKVSSVPGPIHKPTAPDRSPNLRSFTIKAG